MSTPGRSRPDGAGLALLAVTTLGWGLNWPAMKVLLAQWPVLTTRSTAGALGLTLLVVVALVRRESLAVPVALWPRLVLAALLNVTAWMGLASFSLLWLSAAEATIVCYTMPVWATLTVSVTTGSLQTTSLTVMACTATTPTCVVRSFW